MESKNHIKKNMGVEPLQLLPEEKWSELLQTLQLDWPRSVFVINLVETLKRYPELQRSFDFKIYCPYGDPTIGVVAACRKKCLYELVIHCSCDLETLLEAIKGSQVIDWNQPTVQFTDRRVMEAVVRTMRSRGVECWHLESTDTLYMDREPFDVRLPEDVTFGLLSLEHAKLVDSKWVHRNSDTEWYFEQLIKSNLGYGLFEKGTNKLVAWSLYTESGTFDYLYVLDSYRKKGYAEFLSKVAYNSIRKDSNYMYTFCVKGNSTALTLFEKIGFKMFGEVLVTIFNYKTMSRI